MVEPDNLLPPFPNGWYALSLARDLAPGELQARQFMGEEVVLFRTESGAVSLMDAYCPHLGAHMGYGGRVAGEAVRCPFHSFEFDVRGECVSIPYGTRIPPKARARTFPVEERNGLILAYYDAGGRPPDWQIPKLDSGGWSPLHTTGWTFRGHPQETTENSVDIGHFSEVHGYREVAVLDELVTDGPYLTTRYTMTRANAILGRPVTTEFTIHVHGLGYSQVTVEVLDLDLSARLFVLATPINAENIDLRIGLSVKGDPTLRKVHPVLGWIPGGLVRRIVAREILRGFAHDVEQDIPIWRHKRYLRPPILAEGDGPVGRYRLWAKQFYAAEERVLI